MYSFKLQKKRKSFELKNILIYLSFRYLLPFRVEVKNFALVLILMSGFQKSVRIYKNKFK